MKFKSDIEVQAGLKDSSGAVGTSGQVLSSTASGVSWITQSISGYVPYTGATANVNLGAYSITADSFIKIGGTADQYLKADGSVSTAMNSRIEADFVATSGQTTFVTPYEVGQIDVYYNGSKLYPNEFTATNGTSVILAQAATLGAQISIIKYVSSFTTTSIRNESTFTTTAGQTTFAVNYSPGQVDVFYNGSKLNISEFTATNGTSVVLGFACAAGESIVIDSYVNQVSGASGTTNYVSKFTGAASLGNSQIFDNGTNVGIATTTLSEKLNLDGNMLLRSAGAVKFNRSDNAISTDLYDASSYFVLNNRNGNGFAFQSAGSNVVNITSGNLLGIGTGLSGSARLNILNIASAPFLALRSTNNVYEIAKMSFDQNTDILSFVNNQGASTSGITFGTSGTERVRITSVGNIGVGTTNPINGGGAAKWITTEGTTNYSGGLVASINGNAKAYFYSQDDFAIVQGSSGQGVKLMPNGVNGLIIYSNTNYQFVGSNVSDKRAKTKIEDLQINSLEKIMALKSKSYYMKNDPTKIKYGFIAQDVNEILPDLISGDLNGEDFVGLDYIGIIPILTNAIQELKAEIEILKNK